MKRFLVYKVLMVVLCLGMTGNVWGAYNKVNLTVKTNNADWGMGYVKKGKWETTVPTGTETSVSNQSTQGDLYLYLYALPSYGYEFESWKDNGTDKATRFNDTGTAKDAEYFVEEGGGWGFWVTSKTTNHTVQANFKRSQIVLETPLWVYEDKTTTHTITLENPEAKGYWGVVDKNILSKDNWKSAEVDDDNAALDFDGRTWALQPDNTNPTSGATAFSMTYTLPLADKAAMKTLAEKYHNQKKTFTATFVANTGTTGYADVSKNGSGEIMIDLSPYFDINAPENITVGEGETRKDAKIEVTLKAKDENVTNEIAWSIPAQPTAGSNDFVIASNLKPTNNRTATFTVRFVPTQGKGIYTAVFPITANYLGVTYTIECTVVGLYQVDKGEINVLREGVNYNGQTLALDLGSGRNVSQEFVIEHIGVENMQITPSGADAIQYTTETIDASHTRLKVTGTLAALSQVSKTLTLKGISTIGNVGENVDAVTLTLQFTNSYVDQNLKATTTEDAIELTWDENPYSPTYVLKRDGVQIATPAATATGYTDTEADRTKIHLYTLETTVNGKTYTKVVKSMPLGMTVDLSAAYDENGKAVMDVLYVITSETNCDIYDVQDDLTYAKRSGTYNPTTWRPGRIDGTANSKFTKADGTPDNKRVYITGTCERLFWNGTNADGKDNYMGWMQPVNCHVYLDNVRLQAAKVFNDINSNGEVVEQQVRSSIYKKQTLSVGWDEQVTPDISDSVWVNKIPHSASVFYLPDGIDKTANTSSIHLKGNNYLGGSMANAWKFQLDIKVLLPIGGEIDVWPGVIHRTVNYCAPIALKDASWFEGRSFKNGESDAQIVINKKELRLDPYAIDTVPNITCKIDAVWVDGNIVDGYLDLATRTCQQGDLKLTENSMTPTADEYEFMYKSWTQHYGYRYTPCLVTGGNHGKFVINGGRINMWPANGATDDIYYQGLYGNALVKAHIKVSGGHSANYLVCGSNLWANSCDGEMFKNSSDVIATAASKWNPAPYVAMYGVGQGYPVGSLEINGGTITTTTDPLSFAATYVDANGNTVAAKNIDQDGTGQPLLGPKNVVITGGTFQTPIYATTKHGAGLASEATKWSDAVTDADKKIGTNAHNQTLSLVDVAMPAANTDYSSYARNVHDMSEPNTNVGYLVNVGTATEYQYGMANVWSDPNAALCHFYLPSTKGEFYKNYWVRKGETLDKFDTFFKTNHLTVDQGGEITIANNFTIAGVPSYRSTFTENTYQTMTMPFTVDTMFVTDADGRFDITGYVETTDNPSADNSKAYCYVYFLDYGGNGNDGHGEQLAVGGGKAFTDYYHTHLVGSTMRKDKTYVIKFPSVDNDNYWGKNMVTFRGTRGQTINGANAYQGTARPTVSNTFLMDGNATFAKQGSAKLSGSYYVIDAATNGDDDFHATSLTELQPMQGYVVATEETMRRMPRIGRNQMPDVTTDLGNTLAGATVIGGDDKIVVIPAAPATTVQVYAADGQLVGIYTAAEGTPTLIPATAGVYMVRIADSVTKVLVW